MSVKQLMDDSALHHAFGASRSSSSASFSPSRVRNEGININIIDEIRQNLKQPLPQNLKKFNSIRTSGIASYQPKFDKLPKSWHPLDETNSAVVSYREETNSNENVEFINKNAPDSTSYDGKAVYATKDEAARILKELLGYFDLLDSDRSKSTEETQRLKGMTNELTKMLKESNLREQQNYNELKKQRKSLLKWQDNFKLLKEEAQENIMTLLDQREKLKEKLLVASVELKELSAKSDRYEKLIREEEQKSHTYQKFHELYLRNEKEKKENEAEMEVLVLQNSKLESDRNALESERLRLQSLVDEYEAERRVKPSSSLEILNQVEYGSRSKGLNIARTKSPFEHLSEPEVLGMLNNFNLLSEEQKKQNYAEILDELQRATSIGEQYWNYTQYLMSEFDNSGIQLSNDIHE